MFILFTVVLFLLSYSLYRVLQKNQEENYPSSSVGFDYGKVKISPLRDFDIAATKSSPYSPWIPGKFSMTMGIRRLNQENWLELDNQYWKEQELRRHLLENKRHGVMQFLPGSEEACTECLQMIVSYVTRRFPDKFYHPEGKRGYIHNALTRKTFKIEEPYEIHPLEVAAQLVMEDLNLLVKGFGDDPEMHYLVASFSMGPAGWRLQDRIGWPLYKIHGPVPLWEEKLRSAVEKAFSRMKPTDLITRHNFFVQANDVIFQQEPFSADPSSTPRIEDVRIRHERQTLRRLPKTGAILFTVRTFLKPVVDLESDKNSLREFLAAIRALPDDVARYKGRLIWGDIVEEWCERKLKGSTVFPADENAEL